MATSLGTRAAPNQTLGLLRFSLNFLKNFSTTSASPSSATASASASSSAFKKRKRRKKKNLFEVSQFLPNWGIGYHMAKTHWTNVSYEITKINLYKQLKNEDGKHGKAWGIAYKDGWPVANAPKKISGVHKRCWRYIPSLTKSVESTPTLMAPTETPSAEDRAA